MIRPVVVEGDVALVTLTRGYVAVIDAADAPLVAGHNWTAMEHLRSDGTIRTVCAHRKELVDGKRVTVYLHRVIAGTPDDLVTDHIDGDGLNNRRANLRAATTAQNGHNERRAINNTSGVKGVHWHKRDRRWCAKIRLRRKSIYLGEFAHLLDAAEAYAKASAELHGEFGRTA